MAGFLRTLAAAGFAAAVVMAGATTGGMAQSKEEAYKDRVAAMKAMGDNAKIIAAFAKGEGSADAAADAANKIAATAEKIPVLFPQGSSEKDPGLEKSRAKADIWMDFSKFQAAAANLKVKAEDFAKAAKSGDKTMIASAARGVNEACAGCHKPFRGPKK